MIGGRKIEEIGGQSKMVYIQVKFGYMLLNVDYLPATSHIVK